VGGRPRAPGEDDDPLRHHEGRVEAHAELADELGVARLVARQLAEELASAGTRDGAEIRYRLLAAHSDAIVDDTDRARVAIMVDPDRKLRVGAQQLGRVERLEAELVAGVGRIRDQLPQEDLAIAVQRVDHQVQELPDLGLEAQGLLFGRARLPARLAGVAHRLGYLVLSWVLLRW